MKGEVVSIIGGSGSGKDTQASMLAQNLSLPHLSMGGILREEKAKGNPLAIEAATIAEQGKWVPDKITSAILEEYVKKVAPHGFVITGYPRPVEQRESFDRILQSMDLKLLAVVHLRVPDEVLLARMEKQLRDQAIGGKREDVSPAAMKQRLISYHETIGPILEFYRERNQLLDIDGTPSIDEVHHNIIAGLELKRTE